MACRLCNKAPIATVRDLDRDINEGEKSIFQLSQEYEVKPKQIRIHMKKCLGGIPQTGYSVLQGNLRSLRSLAREVKEEYDNIGDFDEDSEARRGYAMRRLLDIKREEREHVMALDRIKPSDKLADEILDSVATPLVVNTTEICTQELGRLRKELSAQLGSDAYVHIDEAIKDALLRIGELLSQEVNQITPQLKKILNTEHAQKRKKSETSKQLSH